VVQVEIEDRAPQLDEPPSEHRVLAARYQSEELFRDCLGVDLDGVLRPQQGVEQGAGARRAQTAQGQQGQRGDTQHEAVGDRRLAQDDPGVRSGWTGGSEMQLRHPVVPNR